MLEHLMQNLARDPHVGNGGLVCFITKQTAFSYIDQMPRSPMPPTGNPLSMEFARELKNALSMNSSIHDGAVIFEDESSEGNYKLKAWSCRLLPPSVSNNTHDNRGSAFNSGLAMSAVDGVEFVFYWSQGDLWRFEAGTGYQHSWSDKELRI